tara:strand:+ start:700 stop:1464 length:765 start_codon:yes stop_codon:yes gene_type:complete
MAKYKALTNSNIKLGSEVRVLNFGRSVDPEVCVLEENKQDGDGESCYVEDRCYNRPLESFRKTLRLRLEWLQEQEPETLVSLAIDELDIALRFKTVLWFRVSVNGSVPTYPSAKLISLLRSMLVMLKEYQVPVHFPVETRAKARRYSSHLSDLCTVRASVDPLTFLVTDVPASTVVRRRGKNKPEVRRNLLQDSLALKAIHYRQSDTVANAIICPFEAYVCKHECSNKQVPDNHKCQACQACSDDSKQIIFLDT